MRAFSSGFMALALLLATAVGVVAEPSDRPAIPSAGCAGPSAETAVPLGLSLLRTEGGDTWLYVPTVYDGSSPLPIWLELHGKGGSGLSVTDSRKLAADEHDFVLVAPTASFGNAGWTWREDDPVLDASRSNPDIILIEAALDEVQSDLCVDLARVYVTGFSGGGEGASVLGCVLEDRIAAVAPVAAMLDVRDACELDRPVPFLAVHGMADGVAYFEGGYSPGYDDFPVVLALAQKSIPERVTNVALRNGCEPDPMIEALDERSNLWSWKCPPEADVQLIVHEGDHVWPTIATETIWDFFQQHPMPEGWTPSDHQPGVTPHLTTG